VRAAQEDGGVAVTFFVDRSLGGKVVAATLRAQGAQVEVHDDHFARDCPDEEWLPNVGRRGWVVLSRDVNIRYRRNELEAARGARVALFILRAKNLRAVEMGACFAAALPGMLRLLARQAKPFVAHIARSGAVELRDPLQK
jgi:predicted nuclease of predicted toxin-antitoxin system